MNTKTINIIWAITITILGLGMLIWGFWPTDQEWFQYYGRL